MATKSEEHNTGERKKVEGVEYANRKRRVEEALKGTGEGLEEMKIIQRERRRRSTEEANEQVEVRKAEGTGRIDIGRRRKD